MARGIEADMGLIIESAAAIRICLKRCADRAGISQMIKLGSPALGAPWSGWCLLVP